ncbi:MAG: SMP-30/gluconolactonase/LRE family protein [Pseudomonadota bacterium]
MNDVNADTDLARLKFHGNGLVRPECVLCHRAGLLFAADWTGPGGVSIIDPETGVVRRHLAADPGANLKPNGILLEPSGAFLLCRLDSEHGGVFRLHPDGQHEPVLTELNGAPLPPTNFAALDRDGRLYVTVSTRRIPRHHAAHAGARDGFIAMLPPGGNARVVADGIGYTNECVFTANGAALLVNATFTRETLSFPVNDDGSLGNPEIVARYGDGIYPDGLAMDEDGGFSMVSIISNTVIRQFPDGRRTLVLQDRDDERVGKLEDAYRSGAITRELLDLPHAGTLKNISSIAFGGADRQTAYFGCLLGDQIASLRVPFVGTAPPHYDVSLAPLADAGLLEGMHTKGL